MGQRYHSLQVRKYHMTLRLVLIIGIVLLTVMLTGYVVAVVQHMTVNGLQGQIGYFSELNDKLEIQNKKYEENNEFLEDKVGNLTELNEELEDQAEIYKIENKKFSTSLNSLNSTNAALQKQVTKLNSITSNLQEKINQLEKESIQLKKAASNLKNVSEIYTIEMDEFSNIRKGIATLANESSQTFDRVLQETSAIFKNLTEMQLFNHKVTLYKVAVNTEHLGERNMDFSKEDYTRFLSQVADLSGRTYKELEQEYPFEKYVGRGGEVTFAQVSEIIEDVLAQKDQPPQPQPQMQRSEVAKDGRLIVMDVGKSNSLENSIAQI